MNRNYRLILVVLCVGILCMTGLMGKDNNQSAVERRKTRELTKIDLDLVNQRAYLSGKIVIKISEKTGTIIKDELMQVDIGFVVTNHPQIDYLNKKFGVTEYMPSLYGLYDISPASVQYRNRHREWGFHLWFELTLDEGADVIDAVINYAALEAVEIAEPVYIKKLIEPVEVGERIETGLPTRWAPNDQYYYLQWALKNTGQTIGGQSGTPGADIQAEDAWDIEKGLSNVIVAVFDRGIEYDHPDLSANMWADIGYDGTDTDAANHGTHVAGTISAVTNNTIGVAGVAGGSGSGDGVRLMSIDIFRDRPPGQQITMVTLATYAADNGAAISQNSWGYINSGVYNQIDLDAIDYFNTNGGGEVMDGGISIFAAGNDNDEGNWYPAYYNGTVAVASTDNRDIKSGFSNFGTWIDISAPGTYIASTIVGNYGYLSGTSMACPHVSGVAALVLSYAYRNGTVLTNSRLEEILLETTDDIYDTNPTYIGKLGTGRVNAYKALLAVDDIYVGDLTPTGTPDEIYTASVDGAYMEFKPDDSEEIYALIDVMVSTNSDIDPVSLFPNPEALGRYFKFTVDIGSVFRNGTYLQLQFEQKPNHLWLRQGEGYWTQIPEMYINWDDTLNPRINLSGLLSNGYRNEIFEFAGDDGETGSTLPVELSSFTALVTTETFVQLEWTAETETNLLGYNIYRGDDSILNNARKVNFVIVAASNSSTARDYSYIDENIEQGNSYYYWLQSNDLDLTEEFHGPISIMVDIKDETGNRIKPNIFTELKEAFPNPFNPGTNILFSLADQTEVKITIYNTKGQLVRLLVDNLSFDKGNNHTVYWDSKDEAGNRVSSGIYFYTMETAGDYKAIKRMLLMK